MFNFVVLYSLIATMSPRRPSSFDKGKKTKPRSRDVKMSFNPWANPAHHGFESGWVKKNSTFSKVGWTQPGSLNPRVKGVRAGL